MKNLELAEFCSGLYSVHTLSKKQQDCVCSWTFVCRGGRKDFAAVTVSMVTAHSCGSIDINYSQSFIARKLKRKN